MKICWRLYILNSISDIFDIMWYLEINSDIINYPLFASAKRGIAMLSVDKFPCRRSKQGVTNLSHALTIFVTFWNVSAASKSQLSH